MNSVRRTTGTRAMKRYETMSFVRMRQRRRFDTQRKARQASQRTKSQRRTRAGTAMGAGRAQPTSDRRLSRSHSANATATARPAQVKARKALARANSPTAGGRGPSRRSGRMRVLNLAPPPVR
jgi:hypothetical protein